MDPENRLLRLRPPVVVVLVCAASVVEEKRDFLGFLAGGGCTAAAAMLSVMVGVVVVESVTVSPVPSLSAKVVVTVWYIRYTSLKCSHSASSL